MAKRRLQRFFSNYYLIMATEFVIRKIKFEDVPTLAVLAKKTFYDTFAGTCTNADMNHFLEKYYSETILADEVKNENFQYFFATINNEAIGYSLFAESNTEFAEMSKKALCAIKKFYNKMIERPCAEICKWI